MAIEIYNPDTPLNQTTNPSPKVLVLNDETGVPAYADAALLKNIVVVDSYSTIAFEGSVNQEYQDETKLYYVKSDDGYRSDGKPRLFRVFYQVLLDIDGIPDGGNYKIVEYGEAYISHIKYDGVSYEPYSFVPGFTVSAEYSTNLYKFISEAALKDSLGNQINTTYSTKTESDLKQTVFTGICQQQYLTENDIYINATDATVVVGGISVPAKNLAILTVRGGTAISASNPICFYTDGSGVAVKHVKSEPQFVPFANLATPTDNTGVWYFYFDSTGTLTASKTAWTSFDNIAAVYRLYWNNGLSGAARNVIEAIECHKNDISWADHAWKHNEGTKWISGFNMTYETTTGTPSATGLNTCVALSTGKNVDDNLFYTVSNVASPVNKFEQDLGSAASITAGGQFICTYNDGSGLLNKIAATRFPFLFNGNNTPQYVTQSGSRADVTPNYFFVYYIYALQDPRVGEAVKIRSAEVEFASASLASAHSWEQLQSKSPTLQDNEIRVLYKCTWEYKSSYDVAVKKAALREVVDLRRQKISSLIASGGSVLASSVVVTPPTGIVSTNAQGAINELALQAFPSNATITGQFAGSTTIPANIPQIYADAQLTNTVTVSLGTPVANAINRYTLKFETGATKPTITWPTNVVWLNDRVPVLKEFKRYSVTFEKISETQVFGRFEAQDEKPVSENGGTIYHTTKWFTPASGQTLTVSADGLSVTLANPVSNFQFTSAMPASKIIVSGYERIINSYTSASVVTLTTPLPSTLFNAVIPYTDWGVYSMAVRAIPFGLWDNFGKAIASSAFGSDVLSITQVRGPSNTYDLYYARFSLSNATDIVFSSTTVYSGTKDLGLRRASAGLLEVFDGVTNGTLKDIKLGVLNYNSQVQNSSDERLKTDIRPISDGLNKVLDIAKCVRHYEYINPEMYGAGQRTGYIAQLLQQNGFAGHVMEREPSNEAEGVQFGWTYKDVVELDENGDPKLDENGNEITHREVDTRGEMLLQIEPNFVPYLFSAIAEMNDKFENRLAAIEAKLGL